MTKRRPKTAQTRLPGFAAPPTAERDHTPVTLPLREVGKGTEDAWFLAMHGGGPKWAARRLVTRGEGPQASHFTMPRWLARENGWLR